MNPMAYFLISIFLLTASHAGMLDFLTLKQAKEAYEKGDYNRSAKLYEEVAKEGSQEALLDAADARYKAGDYKGALARYQRVDKPSLAFEKWHNMGNCYAHLGKIDKGIAAYKKALKIKEDKDTRFNLELLEKLKRQQQRKQNRQKKNDQKKSGQKGRKQNQNQNQNRQQSSNEQQSRQGDQKKQQQQKKNQASKQGDEKKNRNLKEKRQKKGQNGEAKKEGAQKKPKEQKANAKASRQALKQGKEQKNVPISDMELKKWNRELNRRGINTLLLPLQTKESEKRSPDETKPW
ncbi:tetratricopeptide repeat protein [Hydrogenimonas sp. SS33]|uniref:tetratricopeptide repeat protein n=1 Tax=Hydrogenimonas leucolamina TaxID=2954236 RepID=UPI00336BDD26